MPPKSSAGQPQANAAQPQANVGPPPEGKAETKADAVSGPSGPPDEGPPAHFKPKKSQSSLPAHVLTDMPYCYLVERSTWSDFKRALNNCGLSWNLSDWMHTVVYKGKQYMEIASKKPDLDEYFVPELPTGEDGKQINKSFIDLLGFPTTMGEYIQPFQRYCNLARMEFETDSKLPARQKLWTWIVQCLHGPKNQPGQFHYLTHQCVVYDISFLFKRLWDVLETL
jgi:hypothetical protein